jgi:hypothetical protein
MKKTISSHRCSFCKPGIEVDHPEQLAQLNITDTEIQLVIDDKYIVTFPAMVMHYLSAPDASLHGWSAPWKPPLWFVHAVLGAASITFPPTRIQELFLPDYMLGYLTTQQSIEDWWAGKLPEAYKLDLQSKNKNAIIDTQGGDDNFINGEKAEFGSLGALEKPFLEKLESLIRIAQTYDASRKPELGITVNQDKQVVFQYPTLKDVKLEQPPAKKMTINFTDYLRTCFYNPYHAKHKDVLSSPRAVLELVSLPVITSNMSDSEKESKQAEADRKRGVMFGFDRYHLLGALSWTINSSTNSAEAKIDFTLLEESNERMNYSEWNFEKWKPLLLDLFKEINLPVVSLSKDTVVIPLAAMQALKAENGAEIVMKLSLAPVSDHKTTVQPSAGTGPQLFKAAPVNSSQAAVAAASAPADKNEPPAPPKPPVASG